MEMSSTIALTELTEAYYKHILRAYHSDCLTLEETMTIFILLSRIYSLFNCSSHGN